MRPECAFFLLAAASMLGCSRGHDVRPAQTDVLLRVCQAASLDFYEERGTHPQSLRDLQEFVAQTDWARPELLTPHSYEYGTRMLLSGVDAWDRPIELRQLSGLGRPLAWASAGEDGEFGTRDDREYVIMGTYVSDSDE
ncbi:hypothetical protein Mal65_02340 [Crateriforma conspicua]|nr:hypothetical protein Mal65_02340 [Crateriforma conspicua]